MASKKRNARPLTGIQKIAIERMWRLDELAAENVQEHPARARRYVQLIRGLSTRFRVPIPMQVRNRFCKTCENYWIDGVSVTRRITHHTMNMNCKICHTLTRRRVKPQ
jgi:RNase P subunit RPR2